MEQIGFSVPGKPETFGLKQAQLQLFMPHRYPMVLLDDVTECNVIERRLSGTKLVCADDPYVKAHFLGDPIMPPSFLVEAMAQTAGCLMNAIYFSDRGVRFWELPVDEFYQLDEHPHNVLAESKIKQLGLSVAGERLNLHAKVVLQRNDLFAFHVSAHVADRPIAAGEVILANPSYMPSSSAQPGGSHVAR